MALGGMRGKLRERLEITSVAGRSRSTLVTPELP